MKLPDLSHFTVTCTEAINGYDTELRNIVCADVRFDGIKRVYRLELSAMDGSSYETLKTRLIEQLPSVLSQCSGALLAEEIHTILSHASVKHPVREGPGTPDF